MGPLLKEQYVVQYCLLLVAEFSWSDAPSPCYYVAKVMYRVDGIIANCSTNKNRSCNSLGEHYDNAYNSSLFTAGPGDGYIEYYQMFLLQRSLTIKFRNANVNFSVPF